MNAIPLNTTPTDLPALLEGAVETLRAQATSLDVSLSIEAEQGLPRLRIDAEKIAWAVVTLVGNALRYVRHGTRRLPGGSIQVRIYAEAGAVVIAVRDDGPGIPPEKLANLFRRDAGATHAAGLGLLLIRDVLTAHQGTVEVQSSTAALASGTTVTLRIPADPGRPSP